MSVHIETLIHRLRTGISTAELVHVPHDRWPLSRASVQSTRQESRALKIAVLDSSFNPPTLAHRALASVSLSQPPYNVTHAPPDLGLPSASVASGPSSGFDARLLLLSVRNADKALKPGDATYTQRLQMMTLLAQDIMVEWERAQLANSEGPDGKDNVAVAIIDEPTFVGKSRILHRFFQSRLSYVRALHRDAEKTESAPIVNNREESFASSSATYAPHPQMSFVVGIDTLERILSPRYYSSEDAMRDSLRQFLSSDGDSSHLVCARRIMPGQLQSPNEREEEMWRIVYKYIDSGSVTMVDIGEKIQEFSSSEVRERIRIAADDMLWKSMVTDSVAEFIEREGLYLDLDATISGASR
ncbi:hypothetical protein EIP86_002768 [Pleurotus ostreatoroseus]|nr:hypothetical protein EIP86_002768 [Pleurotus ostreatoroseus]